MGGDGFCIHVGQICREQCPDIFLQCLKFQTQLFKILRHGFLPNEGVAIGVRFYFCSVNEGFCKVNAVYGCQHLDKLCEEVF